MKSLASIVAALALALAATPAAAQRVDLSTVTCKDFLASGQDNISYILMWLNGFYTREGEPPVIDFDKMKERGAKLGEYCRTNPDKDLVTAAGQVME